MTSRKKENSYGLKMACQEISNGGGLVSLTTIGKPSMAQRTKVQTVPECQDGETGVTHTVEIIDHLYAKDATFDENGLRKLKFVKV